jgi:hypothetical protein
MATITSGNTATVTLGDYDSVTVQNRVGASASITVNGTVINGSHSGTRTYGPYSAGSVVIVATAGDVYYELADGAAPLSQSGGVAARVSILNGATAGQDSGWLPLSGAPERLMYALDSGTTTTTFSIDISADGVTSLGQAFTGTWASSTEAQISQQLMYSNPQARYFRFNVLSGGPLSVARGA